MEQFLSDRVKRIQPSELLTLLEKGKNMKAAGEDVLAFAGGEPNFDTPKAVSEAAVRALLNGDTHYAASAGVADFRKRISLKLKEENHVDADWEKEILVTAGGKHALSLILSALINPGDEVLLLEPAWVTYRQLIILNGGIPVSIQLDFHDNYRITREKLEAACTPKTKMIIVNTPNNPTGRVLSVEEANILADFISSHGILAVTDEIYEKIIFDGHRNFSLASISRVRDQVITMNGMSKGYAMTGWRLGYIAANSLFIKSMIKLVQNTLSCVAPFEQNAAVYAFDCFEEIEMMRQSYYERRQFMVEALNELPGVECRSPEGGFYLFPRFDIDGMNSWQLADFLLDKAGIIFAPGDAFGAGGEKCLRLSFATAMKDLENAAERLYHLLK